VHRHSLIRINVLIKPTAQKFINIAADVINSAVISTTETYVKQMKNQNIFDVEAQ
jgi:hypothetical protein